MLNSNKTYYTTIKSVEGLLRISKIVEKSKGFQSMSRDVLHYTQRSIEGGNRIYLKITNERIQWTTTKEFWNRKDDLAHPKTKPLYEIY